MRQYILRLDDASDYMDLEKWGCMERLLDMYGIKPIFGIIPKNADESLVSKYEQNLKFWDLMHRWIDKGWTPAMHGYEHRYSTKEGGINPVHKRSEFAGLTFGEQRKKIRQGWDILLTHNIQPDIFFAPSHTFDYNTLRALKNETSIRIINDTVAWDIYKEEDFWFIPQQSGRVRELPFRRVSFCYHPNTIGKNDLKYLEAFLKRNSKHFIRMRTEDVFFINRTKTRVDEALQLLYLCKCNISKGSNG